tara:strand:+ start:2619 stop:3161 length:543 start_codon:yes stop_codon:yes gene_type:complete
MNLQDNQSIHGVPSGVLYGQNERVDELNNRISSRNFADSPLEPHFAPRAVQTKHTIFPIVKNSRHSTESSLPYPVYNNSTNFSPGNNGAPSSGFLQNVDVETILRNQSFGLQHGASQAVYVPSSNSDLYNVTVVSTPSSQPHPDLFTKQQFNNGVHQNLVNTDIGMDRFFNHTRTQLRNE